MIPKRSISEIKTRYKLEPTLDDVFVEGSSDKRLLDRAFAYLGLHRPIYSIESVDVPNEILERLDLTSGNKQRLIALCIETNTSPDGKVRFLVDADLDRALSNLRDIPGLVYTKYCDCESAFLFSDIVTDLVINAGKVTVRDWPGMLRDMEEIVAAVFAVRIAFREVCDNVAIIDFTRCIYVEEERLSIDLDTLVSRSCNVRGGHTYVGKLRSRITHWRSIVRGGDVRNSCRGHDYFLLISWVIKNFKGSASVANALDDIVVLLVPQVARDLVEPLLPGGNS